MKMIFLLNDNNFRDENIYKFAIAFAGHADVLIIKNAAIEHLNSETEQGSVLYLETNYIHDVASYLKLISEITYQPAQIYLLPHAPKRLVNALKTHFKCDIYQFPYKDYEPAFKIY